MKEETWTHVTDGKRFTHSTTGSTTNDAKGYFFQFVEEKPEKLCPTLPQDERKGKRG